MREHPGDLRDLDVVELGQLGEDPIHPGARLHFEQEAEAAAEQPVRLGLAAKIITRFIIFIIMSK